jgi:flavodoxin
MKTLVVYYSRTHTTQKAAEIIADRLGETDEADIIDLKDNIDRSGVGGYLRSGRDVVFLKKPKLESLGKELNSYDQVVVGTPIWAWNMSAPVRSFMTSNKDILLTKNVSFFCTMGSSGDTRCFQQMQMISGVEPNVTLSLLTKDVHAKQAFEQINEFVKKLR